MAAGPKNRRAAQTWLARKQNRPLWAAGRLKQNVAAGPLCARRGAGRAGVDAEQGIGRAPVHQAGGDRHHADPAPPADDVEQREQNQQRAHGNAGDFIGRADILGDVHCRLASVGLRVASLFRNFDRAGL